MKPLHALKAIFILALILFLSNSAAVGQTRGQFEIQGTISSINPEPAKIYLTVKGSNQATDSCKVIDHRYHFSGYIDEPTDALISKENISSSGVYDFIPLIIDKGYISLSSTYKMANFTIEGKGAQAQLDYQAAIHKTIVFADSLKKIAASEEFKTNDKLRSSVQIAASNLLEPMTQQMIAFLKNYPNSPAGVRLMVFIAASPFTQPELADSLLNTLPVETAARAKKEIGDQIDRKRALQQVKKDNADLTAIGSTAKDFTMNDVNGKPVSLSSFKGKFVLVDFWASWCSPCRAENPNVIKAYETYKSKGFTVLGVSLDGAATKKAWLAAIKKDGLSWTEVSDLSGWNSEAAKIYGVTSIPQNFLIDPSGKIIGKNLRGADLQDKLASIFIGK